RGRRVRRPVGVADDGAAGTERGRALRPVQGAELRGNGASPVEDAFGGAPGVPQVAPACGSAGLPDASSLDRLSTVGTAVSPTCRRRRGAGGAASDGGVAAARVSQLRADRASVGGGAGGACDAPPDGSGTAPAAAGLPRASTAVSPSAISPANGLTLHVTDT